MGDGGWGGVRSNLGSKLGRPTTERASERVTDDLLFMVKDKSFIIIRHHIIRRVSIKSLSSSEKTQPYLLYESKNELAGTGRVPGL